ncbi:hypothetical protein JQ633_05855 [Bradyrhizobium tropiciagri]|uniref:hypothetical protein n=1 Tax=Bradyrhizobium tropiciagri TaxID=312253 RepID=UPI001BA8E5B3|nr:hypothetical protein [Bradyrhizobium tropiciagri]MBR0869872.1 hypothetical protein [Bradyrhizobium tropiciagri]
MMNRQAEVNRLDEADRHISRGEIAVSKQLAMVERLKHDGHDTAEAVRQLSDFEAVLATMRERRSSIAKLIEQIDAGLA